MPTLVLRILRTRQWLTTGRWSVRRLLVIAVLLCLTGSGIAQQPPSSRGVGASQRQSVLDAIGQQHELPPAKKKAVYGTDYYVAPSAYNYSGVARRIVGDASTSYERAERIFRWVCENVSFDRTNSVRTADAAWRSRSAVCQGYCELFFRLAETVGVKSRLVYGKCRRPMYATLQDHVWLCIQTDRGTVLADPTWGSGFYFGDHFVRLADPLLWFDVDPAWLIFTHLPKNDSRQQLSPVVTDDQFMTLPYTTPLTALIGIDAPTALRRQLDGSGSVPVVRMQNAAWPADIALREVPATLHLHTDSAYTFRIEKLRDGGTLSLANGPDVYPETQWTREPDSEVYTLVITPRHTGSLQFTLQTLNGVLLQQQKILEYVVDAPAE